MVLQDVIYRQIQFPLAGPLHKMWNKSLVLFNIRTLEEAHEKNYMTSTEIKESNQIHEIIRNTEYTSEEFDMSTDDEEKEKNSTAKIVKKLLFRTSGQTHQ